MKNKYVFLTLFLLLISGQGNAKNQPCKSITTIVGRATFFFVLTELGVEATYVDPYGDSRDLGFAKEVETYANGNIESLEIAGWEYFFPENLNLRGGSAKETRTGDVWDAESYCNERD